MKSLAIDTSTDVCSVAFFDGDELLSLRIDANGRNHAVLLSVFVREVLEQCDALPDQLIFSQGPGSYTGLRIGAATAKGLCFGWNIPLVPISTLLLIAVAADSKADYICPMIDARRMEVYSALYDSSWRTIDDPQPMIVDTDCYATLLQQHTICFAGNGAQKCRQVITGANAQFAPTAVPLAANAMKALALTAEPQRLTGTQLAYYEPFYLKEFQATKSRKLI